MGTKVDDYYEILGLDPSATTQHVRRAFRLRAMARHRKGASRIARELGRMEEAHEVLRSPGLRQRGSELTEPRDSGRARRDRRARAPLGIK
jgi:curved DNA-binding protein CbpA